jgi:MFS family permease
MGAMYLSQTLIVFWLYIKGYGFSDLVIYNLFCYLVALVGIVFLPRINTNAKRAMLWGIVFSALIVLTLIRIWSPFQLFLSAFFSGLNVIFFWIPYNAMFFKFSSEEKRGTNSGMYFLITPIIGITLIPLTGIFAQRFGFETMFLIGFFTYLIPIILLKFLPDFNWQLDLKEEFSKIKFNWSTFLQGATWRVSGSLVPIFSLFFFKTPREFGNFFGYLALITGIASVINGYISDKIKNRKYFFYFFSFLAVVSFLPLPFVTNVYTWSIFAGISGLCMNLASPFWLTFNLDYYKEFGVRKTMALRELFLNSGYTFTMLVVFLVYYFTHSTKISLLVICVLCCFLPIASYLQKIYIKKNG